MGIDLGDTDSLVDIGLVVGIELVDIELVDIDLVVGISLEDIALEVVLGNLGDIDIPKGIDLVEPSSLVGIGLGVGITVVGNILEEELDNLLVGLDIVAWVELDRTVSQASSLVVVGKLVVRNRPYLACQLQHQLLRLLMERILSQDYNDNKTIL